jgi:hypothetical protein
VMSGALKNEKFRPRPLEMQTSVLRVGVNRIILEQKIEERRPQNDV